MALYVMGTLRVKNTWVDIASQQGKMILAHTDFSRLPVTYIDNIEKVYLTYNSKISKCVPHKYQYSVFY